MLSNLRRRSTTLLLVAAGVVLATGIEPALGQVRKRRNRALPAMRAAVEKIDADRQPIFDVRTKMSLRELNPAGLEIVEVPLGPARNAGLEAGDVIREVNGVPIRNMQNFRGALAAQLGPVARMRVWDRRTQAMHPEPILVVLAAPDLPPLPPPPAPLPNLAGVWHTNLGTLRLIQIGPNAFDGTLDILFGGTSRITGAVIGNSYQFNWNSDVPRGFGSGTLTPGPNGSLSGTYVNQIDNSVGVWTMTR